MGQRARGGLGHPEETCQAPRSPDLGPGGVSRTPGLSWKQVRVGQLERVFGARASRPRGGGPSSGRQPQGTGVMGVPVGSEDPAL